MEVTYQQRPEMQPTSLGSSSSEMDGCSVEMCAVSDKSAFQVVDGNNGCCVLQAKEEKHHQIVTSVKF